MEFEQTSVNMAYSLAAYYRNPQHRCEDHGLQETHQGSLPQETSPTWPCIKAAHHQGGSAGGWRLAAAGTPRFHLPCESSWLIALPLLAAAQRLPETSRTKLCAAVSSMRVQTH